MGSVVNEYAAQKDVASKDGVPEGIDKTADGLARETISPTPKEHGHRILGDPSHSSAQLWDDDADGAAEHTPLNAIATEMLATHDGWTPAAIARNYLCTLRIESYTPGRVYSCELKHQCLRCASQAQIVRGLENPEFYRSNAQYMLQQFRQHENDEQVKQWKCLLPESPL